MAEEEHRLTDRTNDSRDIRALVIEAVALGCVCLAATATGYGVERELLFQQ
jgi:hypothetical protein